MPDKNYYKILGLSESASLDDIKKAYRKLAKKYHPDMNMSDKKGAEAKFKEVSEAYYVLGDEKRKKEFDMYKNSGNSYSQRGQGTQRPSAGRQQQTTWNQGFNIEDLFSHLGSQGRTATGTNYDLFDDMFTDLNSGGAKRRPAARQVSNNIEASVEIPKDLAASGGKVDLTLPSGKRITVNIPKGVSGGAKLRLQGLGDPCPCCSKNGDLLLKIAVK